MGVILLRAALLAAGACGDGLAYYDLKTGRAPQVEYTAEADTLVRADNPGYWQWLREQRLVPKYPYGYGSGYGDGDGDGSTQGGQS